MPRVKGEGVSYYHCLSRIVGREFLLGVEEREFFVSLMRRLETFHGCRVLTYCVMSNHFHLLLEMPDPAEAAGLDRGEILRRVGALYGSDGAAELRRELDAAASSGSPRWEEEILERYRRRMGDVSVYMKQLKQRFSLWYNRRKGRKGTLWEERYKSVLVEGGEQALLAVAAYIDLNPLRAGMVAKVEDYRWCGYAAAEAGERRARKGLAGICGEAAAVSAVSGATGQDRSAGWAEVGPLYRMWLYGRGELRELPGAGRRPERRGFTREEVEAEIARGGRLPLPSLLRVRVRYFSDGIVLGSAAFVEGVYQRHRSRFGMRRTTGARTMRGADWGGLRVMRDLRAEVFG